MNSEQRMTNIFARVGKEFGFNSVCVSISALKDLKFKWEGIEDRINFKVSDYLSKAPENVLESLATSIYSRLKGENVAYPEEICDYLTSDDFVIANQDKYLKRTTRRFKIVDDEDVLKTLTDSYQRLVDKNLVREIDNLRLTVVSAYPTERDALRTSTVFRCITMPDFIVNLGDEKLDYMLFTQLLTLDIGFKRAVSDSKGAFEEKLRRIQSYPDYARISQEVCIDTHITSF